MIENSIQNYLEGLASDDATVGGGTAAALSAAMAASLVTMVARLTVNKPKYATEQVLMQEIIVKADQLRIESQHQINQDSQAFAAVMKAYRLSKQSEDEQKVRRQAIEDAFIKAAQVPLKVAQMAVSILHLALIVIEKGNPNAQTDGLVGAHLALAAYQSAILNVTVNLKSIDEPSTRIYFDQHLSQLKQEVDILNQQFKSMTHD